MIAIFIPGSKPGTAMSANVMLFAETALMPPMASVDCCATAAAAAVVVSTIATRILG